ncbi:MAG TPA: hypothetical protein DGF30_02080 [Desulfomicrobium sp.]|nr:hypothetical protein [Desulfomicrobium sp.]
MHLAIFKIYPVAGAAPSVIDVLESMRVALAADVSCLCCSVAFETGEDGAIVFTERWQSWEALKAHLRSTTFSRMLEAMEWSRKAPTTEFFDATALGGMEVIEEARGRSPAR